MSALVTIKTQTIDLLKSLEINPDDAYVLNYLAYSWLEREYKIDTALEMLENAYASRSNESLLFKKLEILFKKSFISFLLKAFDNESIGFS